MTMTETAKSYASALFSVADEMLKTEDYKASLELVREIFEKNPKYKEFLSSPQIPLPKRLDALSYAFGDSLPREVRYFLCLVCKNGDIDKIFFVIDEYMLLYKASKKIKTIKVTSAEPLESKQIDALSKIMEKITESKVVFEIGVDKSIIGGIKLEIDGKVFDGSLKRRLDLLKEKISR